MARKNKNENTEPLSEETQVSSNEKYSYIVKNKKARIATRHRKAITIVGIVIIILLLLVGLIFGFYSAVEINNFKIFVDPSGSKKLSLSPYRNMVPSSEMIELIGPERMTNTTLAKGKNIAGSTPIEERLLDIIACEGSLTTVDDFYIAGTFYMQNITENEMLYNENITFQRSTKGAYRALRIMIIRNGVITVYAAAKTDADGNYIYLDEEGRRIYSDESGYFYLDGEEKVPVENNGALQREEVVPISSVYAERKLALDENGEYYVEISDERTPWMTELFDSEEFAVHNENIAIAPGETVKYSVVIWFEGWDSDCVDNILDGEIELALSFSCN